MKTKLLIEILNKECKNLNHDCCHGCWESFDVEVRCNCSCHHHNKIFVKKREDESGSITEFLRYDNYQKNFIKFNTENGLTKQNSKNDLLTKSFEGPSQQTQAFMERREYG